LESSKVFESKERLRIGFLTSLPPFLPLGDTPDVIMKAKAYLEYAGHILVPFAFPFEPSKCEEIPWDTSLYARLDRLLRNDLVYEGIHSVYRKEEINSPSVGKYEDILSKKETLIDALLDEMKVQDVDLILCPVFPFPALGVEDASVLVGKDFFAVFVKI
jgi:Asp-tRNA(Asn)/Glu-tRNA(Gln) amidotransferase A subunit family amidase